MDAVRPKNTGNKLQKTEYTIPGDILDDLSSRFIINIPEAERKDLIRVLFQIELAHWFYIDFYCKRSGSSLFKPCGMREFTLYIFKHIPFLKPYANDVDRIIEEWKDYKFSVPTFGAILLDEDLSHVLLVQSYWSKSSWGFPKGKINKSEAPCHCAIREVFEETGYNITPEIDPNEYIEANIHEQMVRLYIIPGISKETEFMPRTRNEIRAVSWFPLSDLPANRKDVNLKFKTGMSNNAFFMVSPFLRKLRQWIAQHSHDPLRRLRRNRYKSCGDIESIFELSNDFLKIKDNKRRTPEFISQVREDTTAETGDHIRVSSCSTDGTSLAIEKKDKRINKKDMKNCEQKESEVKIDNLHEAINCTDVKNANVLLVQVVDKTMNEEKVAFNKPNDTELESISDQKKELEMGLGPKENKENPEVKNKQEEIEVKEKNQSVLDGHLESPKKDSDDCIHLSEKIEKLEIKAWRNFRFDLQTIFD